MIISHIFRYPVKGLSAEMLANTRLKKGEGIPFDRYVAITHKNSQFDSSSPQWMKRGNFAVIARSPVLASFKSRFDPEHHLLSFELDNGTLLNFNLDDKRDWEALNDYLEDFIGNTQPGPYGLATIPGTNLTDSPEQAISLMNKKSLDELAAISGVRLSKARFRGNIWFESRCPWSEFEWIGQEIRIGDAKLEIFEKIQRCAAIEANPESGLRDSKLLSDLRSNYGHTDFGVLARVISAGDIEIGDEIEVIPRK